MVEDIKQFGNFILQHESGVVNDTPWEGLRVKSVGLAGKHVVEIRLDTTNIYDFNGEPVKYMYRNVYVSHGVRMKQDTLAETQEYIEVLREAIEVAFDVHKYCVLNGWWK